MKINKDDIKKRIIYRASYRGTKELDILISKFVNNIINSSLNYIRIYFWEDFHIHLVLQNIVHLRDINKLFQTY